MSDQKKPAEKPANGEQPMPAAGPHAKPELTNPDATPGTGSLPEPGEASDGDMQPTS